nr:hypothetical protein [uncultured Ruegeria sp.]
MIDHALFALSAGIAQVSTNLDNLAVLFGLIVVMGRRRPVVGFAVAQTVVLLLATAVAIGLSHSTYPTTIGYLGVVPLALGVRGIWLQISGRGKTDTQPQGAVISVVFLFLSLSIDTFAVMTPLLAESSTSYRWAGLFGAATAACLLTGVAAWGAPKAKSFAPRMARLDRIAPYIMVAVGLYILLNTGTDAL